MYLLRQTTVAIALLLVPLEFQPQEAKQKPAEKSAPEAQSPYFIEQYDLRVRFENDGTGWQELHVRSHVRTQRGAEQLSWIAFGYDRSSEQIEINSIVVHKPSGGAIEVLPGAVVDRPVIAVKDAPAYEDAREKTVHVPALNPGDTLEYRATKTVTKSLAPGQFWFEHSFLRDAPVGEESFEMDVPGDREIHLKIRHDGVPPAIVMESQAGNGIARRVHKWKISNENAGSTKQTASKDAAMPAANPQAPDIQLTTFQNWGEVARWYSAKESQTTAADEAISAKTAELTRDSKDDLQKLEALYSFVSQKIRTVSLPFGASGFRSQAPGQVLT